MAVQSFKQEVKTSTSPRAGGQGHFIPVLSSLALQTGYKLESIDIYSTQVQSPTNHPSI